MGQYLMCLFCIKELFQQEEVTVVGNKLPILMMICWERLRGREKTGCVVFVKTMRSVSWCFLVVIYAFVKGVNNCSSLMETPVQCAGNQSSKWSKHTCNKISYYKRNLTKYPSYFLLFYKNIVLCLNCYKISKFKNKCCRLISFVLID